MSELAFPFVLDGRRVWIAGHRGMVGAALMRRLAGIECEVLTATRQELDLRDAAATRNWIARHRPEVVFVTAGTVGGIAANMAEPATFLRDNLAIAQSIIHASHQAGVSRLIYLASSSVYPRLASQPIAESALLTAPLEPTNEWYAVAKIAGIKLCQAYRRQYGDDFLAIVPCNLYGQNDRFDPRTSHLMAALIRKIDLAVRDRSDVVELWGTGTPRREFLHVDDMADACVFAARNWNGDGHLNIGSGIDHTVHDLAQAVAAVIGFSGRFVFDASLPDGPPQKLLDVSRLNSLGWRPRLSLEEGLRMTYDWYRAFGASLRSRTAEVRAATNERE